MHGLELICCGAFSKFGGQSFDLGSLRILATLAYF